MVMRMPEKDENSMARDKLEAHLVVAMGGRVAEDLIFGHEKVTTGAANDIAQATEMARKMVTVWGMSDKLGPLRYTENQEEVFLGHSVRSIRPFPRRRRRSSTKKFARSSTAPRPGAARF